MSAQVLLASPYGPLVLTVDQLLAALQLAREVLPRDLDRPEAPPRAQGAPLVDAHEAARQLGVKATWLLTRARERRIPHTRVGKFVRFDLVKLREVLAGPTNR